MTNPAKKTDWSAYYRTPFFFARFTRKILGDRMVKVLSRFIRKENGAIRIAELGGGNSCFCQLLRSKFPVADYFACDIHEEALRMLESRCSGEALTTRCMDLLEERLPEQDFDLVFSGGLIEHFPEDGTAVVIRRHFEAAKQNGLVLILAPTPTLLYRITRKTAELLGLWIFADERPLTPEEIRKTGQEYGECIYQGTIYSVFLTQTMQLFRKDKSPQPT